MRFMYIVKPNDTLLSISEQFEINTSDLISFNNLDDYKIKAGDCLEIPSKKEIK